MSKQKRQLHFNIFATKFGHHPSGWRHEDSTPIGQPSLRYWVELAQMAERGKFDAVFLADFAGITSESKSTTSAPMSDFEPYTLAGALAASTSNVGIIATVNTNYDLPYHTARRFASLDHLTNGRAGWNIVSSLWENSQKSFGVTDPLDHGARYERAAEFVELSKGLWDSWDDDAFLHADKTTGMYGKAGGAHPVRHRGKYFDADGTLDVARPPQGYPVFVQAGNSGTGRDFAARYAEMTYASATSEAVAREYYDDLKARAASYGRDPDSIVITPGLSFTIGSSDAEAEDKYEALQAQVDFSGKLDLFGVDVSGIPLDGPLPPLPQTENSKGRLELAAELARRENLSLRQLILRVSVTKGHRVLLGTAKTIADGIEDWFIKGVADGFNLIPPVMPTGLEDFVNEVVPELQRRGLFRKEYEGSTLREHLGLKRPENSQKQTQTAAERSAA